MGTGSIHLPLAAFVAVLLPSVGYAASDAEVEALRAEIAALKSDYAARVSALEARLNQLEAAPVPTPAAPVEPSPAPAAAKSAAAFNPAISVILTGNYADLSQDPADYHIAGFMTADVSKYRPGSSANCGRASWACGSV